MLFCTLHKLTFDKYLDFGLIYVTYISNYSKTHVRHMVSLCIFHDDPYVLILRERREDELFASLRNGFGCSNWQIILIACYTGKTCPMNSNHVGAEALD